MKKSLQRALTVLLAMSMILMTFAPGIVSAAGTPDLSISASTTTLNVGTGNQEVVIKIMLSCGDDTTFQTCGYTIGIVNPTGLTAPENANVTSPAHVSGLTLLPNGNNSGEASCTGFAADPSTLDLSKPILQVVYTIDTTEAASYVFEIGTTDLAGHTSAPVSSLTTYVSSVTVTVADPTVAVTNAVEAAETKDAAMKADLNAVDAAAVAAYGDLLAAIDTAVAALPEGTTVATALQNRIDALSTVDYYNGVVALNAVKKAVKTAETKDAAMSAELAAVNAAAVAAYGDLLAAIDTAVAALPEGATVPADLQAEIEGLTSVDYYTSVAAVNAAYANAPALDNPFTVAKLPAVENGAWSITSTHDNLAVAADGSFTQRPAGIDAADVEGVVFKLTISKDGYSLEKTYGAITVNHLDATVELFNTSLETLMNGLLADAEWTTANVNALENDAVYAKKAEIESVRAMIDVLGEDTLDADKVAIFEDVEAKLAVAVASIKPYKLTATPIEGSGSNGYTISVAETGLPSLTAAPEGEYYIVVQLFNGTTNAGIFACKANGIGEQAQVALSIPGVTSFKVYAADKFDELGAVTLYANALEITVE